MCESPPQTNHIQSNPIQSNFQAASAQCFTPQASTPVPSDSSLPSAVNYPSTPLPRRLITTSYEEYLTPWRTESGGSRSSTLESLPAGPTARKRRRVLIQEMEEEEAVVISNNQNPRSTSDVEDIAINIPPERPTKVSRAPDMENFVKVILDENKVVIKRTCE